MPFVTKESTVKLRNKINIPIIGLDTELGSDKFEETKAAVLAAVDAGYVLFICDPSNETAVGEALKIAFEEKKIKREDLFITTKVYWNAGDKENYVEESLQTSLKNLGLHYVDLLLFHCPIIRDKRKMDYSVTWRGMEKCVNTNLTKSIGLSNFYPDKIKRLLKITTIKPVVNLLECNVLVNRKELRKFCKQKKILLMASKPCGPINQFTSKNDPGRESPEKEELNKLEEIRNLAVKYNKTNCQIAIRYLIDLETIPIIKTGLQTSIEANMNIFDFSLTEKEMKILNKIDNGTYDPNPTVYNVYKEDYAYIEF